MKGYSKFKSQCGIGNQTFGETLMNSISFQLKNHMNIKMITQSCLCYTPWCYNFSWFKRGREWQNDIQTASILKADIWPHFRFYELTGKKELSETHVMCKTCTTANTTHHVSCFHSEPTATNIKNTASPANHFWNVHRQYGGSVVSAVVLQQKGSGFETWLGQSSLPCWAPLSCGVCRFSPGTPAPSHSPKLREWSIILKGNVTGCLSLCFTPFDKLATCPGCTPLFVQCQLGSAVRDNRLRIMKE